MLVVLDASVHVHAATSAGVALDRRIRVDDLELVGVLRDLDLVFRHDRDDGEIRAFGLPALGAAARVLVRYIRTDTDFDRILRAFADERSARKVLRTGLDA